MDWKTLDFIPDSICAIDGNGKITSSNLAFKANIFGAKLSDIYFVDDLLHIEDREKFRSGLNRLLFSDSSNDMKVTVGLCRTLVSFEFNIPNYRDFDWIISRPDTQKIICVGRIVSYTENDKTETRFKELTEFANFFDNSPLQLFWLSSSGHLLWSNKSFIELLGYSDEDLIGQHISKFCDEDSVIHSIFENICAGRIDTELVLRLKTKCGLSKSIRASSIVSMDQISQLRVQITGESPRIVEHTDISSETSYEPSEISPAIPMIVTATLRSSFSEPGITTQLVNAVPIACLQEATRVELEIVRSKSRILVVDDSSICQKMLRRVLHKIGYDTDGAETGLACVEILRADPTGFDAVLMDIRMPVMNGIDCTTIIRNTLGLRLPIVALTAECDTESCNQIMMAGANAFIRKPARIRDIVNALNELNV